MCLEKSMSLLKFCLTIVTLHDKYKELLQTCYLFFNNAIEYSYIDNNL